MVDNWISIFEGDGVNDDSEFVFIQDTSYATFISLQGRERLKGEVIPPFKRPRVVASS